MSVFPLKNPEKPTPKQLGFAALQGSETRVKCNNKAAVSNDCTNKELR